MARADEVIRALSGLGGIAGEMGRNCEIDFYHKRRKRASIGMIFPKNWALDKETKMRHGKKIAKHLCAKLELKELIIWWN